MPKLKNSLFPTESINSVTVELDTKGDAIESSSFFESYSEAEDLKNFKKFDSVMENVIHKIMVDTIKNSNDKKLDALDSLKNYVTAPSASEAFLATNTKNLKGDIENMVARERNNSLNKRTDENKFVSPMGLLFKAKAEKILQDGMTEMQHDALLVRKSPGYIAGRKELVESIKCFVEATNHHLGKTISKKQIEANTNKIANNFETAAVYELGGIGAMESLMDIYPRSNNSNTYTNDPIAMIHLAVSGSTTSALKLFGTIIPGNENIDSINISISVPMRADIKNGKQIGAYLYQLIKNTNFGKDRQKKPVVFSDKADVTKVIPGTSLIKLTDLVAGNRANNVSSVSRDISINQECGKGETIDIVFDNSIKIASLRAILPAIWYDATAKEFKCEYGSAGAAKIKVIDLTIGSNYAPTTQSDLLDMSSFNYVNEEVPVYTDATFASVSTDYPSIRITEMISTTAKVNLSNSSSQGSTKQGFLSITCTATKSVLNNFTGKVNNGTTDGILTQVVQANLYAEYLDISNEGLERITVDMKTENFQEKYNYLRPLDIPLSIYHRSATHTTGGFNQVGDYTSLVYDLTNTMKNQRAEEIIMTGTADVPQPHNPNVLDFGNGTTVGVVNATGGLNYKLSQFYGEYEREIDYNLGMAFAGTTEFDTTKTHGFLQLTDAVYDMYKKIYIDENVPIKLFAYGSLLKIHQILPVHTMNQGGTSKATKEIDMGPGSTNVQFMSEEITIAPNIKITFVATNAARMDQYDYIQIIAQPEGIPGLGYAERCIFNFTAPNPVMHNTYVIQHVGQDNFFKWTNFTIRVKLSGYDEKTAIPGQVVRDTTAGTKVRYVESVTPEGVPEDPVDPTVPV